jgi:glucose dehydrogenase
VSSKIQTFELRWYLYATFRKWNFSFPGNLGVFEWGGMSVNADRQVAVMNPIGLPFVSRLVPADPNRPQTAKGAGTEQGCSQCMARHMV